MKKTAFVFPGQGSQKVGMLRELALHYPRVRTDFNMASDLLHYDLWDLIANGPEVKLNDTRYTQPAMLTADLAVFNVWRDEFGIMPSLLAGHSLGEYAAWVVAGALTFAEALKWVALRGEFMHSAVSGGEGAMAAILGLKYNEVLALCQEASMDGIVSIANINAPGQLVIAGTVVTVESVSERAREHHGKVIRLPVSVPSHCPLMQPAADQLQFSLLEARLGRPHIPVVNNVDVRAVYEKDEIKSALVRQLVSPVRWVETIEFIVGQGVEVVVECGPGKVLTGLNKRISDDLLVFSMSSLAEMNTVNEVISK